MWHAIIIQYAYCDHYRGEGWRTFNGSLHLPPRVLNFNRDIVRKEVGAKHQFHELVEAIFDSWGSLYTYVVSYSPIVIWGKRFNIIVPGSSASATGIVMLVLQ